MTFSALLTNDVWVFVKMRISPKLCHIRAELNLIKKAEEQTLS